MSTIHFINIPEFVSFAIAMSTPKFIADFTEDIQDVRTCDQCSVDLNPGDSHLIHSFKPGQPNKLVCTDCLEYYKNKPTTICVCDTKDHNKSGM